MTAKARTRKTAFICALSGALMSLVAPAAVDAASAVTAKPKFSTAVAFDVSRPAREIAPPSLARRAATATDELLDIRPERGPVPADNGFTGDGAVFPSAARLMAPLSATIAAPIVNFEGLSNQDNFNLFDSG